MRSENSTWDKLKINPTPMNSNIQIVEIDMPNRKGSPGKSYEIVIGNEIEKMLRSKIFDNRKYIIRHCPEYERDHNTKKQELILYSKEGLNRTVNQITDPDILVLNDEKPETVELILEIELTTRPKDIIGNFIAPFLTCKYISAFSNDKNIIYYLDPKKTLMFHLVCYKNKRLNTPKQQAPLQKGKLVRNWLVQLLNKSTIDLPIYKFDVLISDEIDILVKDLYQKIFEFRSDLKK